MPSPRLLITALLLYAAGAGCDDASEVETPGRDSQVGSPDAQPPDGGQRDGGPDAGVAEPDALPPDAAPPDGALDAALDMAIADAGPPDAGEPDMGAPDMAPPDMAPPDMAPTDAGPRPDEALVTRYCNCVFLNCHDLYHEVWGEDEVTARLTCLEVGAELPLAGEPMEAGHSIECRLQYCARAMNEPEQSCPPALGLEICVEVP